MDRFLHKAVELVRPEIWWAPLSNCPENQLTKPGNSTDAGWDIHLAEDVEIVDYRALSYEWTELEPFSSLNLPQLKEKVMNYELSEGEDFRFGDARIVNKENVLLIQKKKYKPILAKTGIIVNPQVFCWTGIHLRSSAPKYGVALANNVGIVDYSYPAELLVQLTLQPGASYTYLKKGERIAQLVPQPQFADLQMIKKKPEDMRSLSDRGGLGSTGI